MRQRLAQQPAEKVALLVRGVAAGQCRGAAPGLAERGRALLADMGLGSVQAPRLRAEMCKTCACQPGSVPNGCLQTQLDFLKAAAEGTPFLCHSPMDGRMCAGWVRARGLWPKGVPEWSEA